jgi:hypothetical protein
MKQIDLKFINKFWERMGTFDRGVDEEYMQDADVRPEILTPRDRYVRKVVARIKFAPFYRFMIKGEMYIGAPYIIMFAYTRADKISVHFISAQTGKKACLTLSPNDTREISYEEISKEQFFGTQNICIGTDAERFNNNYKTVQQVFASHMDEIQSHPLTKLVYERLDTDLNRDKLQGVADLIIASGIYREDGSINSKYETSKRKKKELNQFVLPENMPSGNAWFYLDDVCKSLKRQNYIKFNEGL